MSKLYYLLTAYIPRPLPKTLDEFEVMRQKMIKYYGLEDDPKVTYTLASQLMTGPPFSLRRSYGHMVNAAKKLRIAKLTQDLRVLAIERETDMLKEKAAKEEVAKNGSGELREGSHNNEAELSIMQEAEGKMVYDARAIGLQ